jgi:sulfoxide reductase heme-binding subunit YedZ
MGRSVGAPEEHPGSEQCPLTGGERAKPGGSLNIEQRYRWIYKPLVFAASLIPFAWLLCGAFGWFGTSLGADPVKKLEHECGKWALNFLLITLAVTPVRQLAHLPHLPRLRRMLGLFAFCYAVLHFTVYLTLDLELNFGTLFADIAKRPYITIGFLALLLLIPLAVTSTNKMMRRLGRRWQKLHRLIYVIAVLGVWHFYWQVKRDIREPLIYAGILAVLLGYRWIRAELKKPVPAAAVPAATSKSGSATAPERT